ncbi:MAG: glutamate mutase L, partial [Candidatus Thorarchaeota archaeon]
PTGEIAEAKITPNRRCDVGAGTGKSMTTKVEGGEAGIIIDARGRPLVFPDDKEAMRRLLLQWFTALNLYPKRALEKFIKEAD